MFLDFFYLGLKEEEEEKEEKSKWKIGNKVHICVFFSI